MNTKENRPKLIVVLGMHRSGTSVITRALQVLGVDLGDKLLPPLEGVNVKGFWEDVELNSLNIEMLNAVHSDWHFLTPIQETDVTELHRQGYLSRAVEMLKVKTDNISAFGFKDPRTAKLLLFWKDVFAQSQMDVSYVISMRNPLSVCKSLAKRDGFDFEKSYLLWLDHVINSLIETDGKSRVLVDYDRLIQSPNKELERIAGKLQLEIDLDELEKFKEEFIDIDLRHTVHQFDDLMADDSAPPLVKEVYSDVLNITLNANALNNAIPVQKITQWKNELYRQKSALMLADKLTLKMHQNLTEFSLRLTERDQQIAERDQQIAERDQQIAERDQQIVTLTEMARELSVIKSSRSWRIYLRLIEPMRRLFPPNSSQVKLFDLAWKGIREVYRNGIKSFIFKATPHVKSAVWKVLKRRRVSPGRTTKLYIQVEPVSTSSAIVSRNCSIDIIVCVHNALDDIRRCLESIEQFTNNPYRIILVDDGSSQPTQKYLQDFSYGKEHCVLLRNEEAGGYTRAANKGLKSSTAEFIVLLNSDTIVGPEWVDRMYSAITSNDQYGVAGPLSNTASWQSIPKLEVNGDWADNPIPNGMSVGQMGNLIAKYSGIIRPEATLLNGFCMMIKRALLNDIGYFDEERFGDGYGEEDDFTLRARNAGWKLVIADDVYIYHAQSKSYSHERRRLLYQSAGQKLREKHDGGIILDSVQYMHPNRVMEGIRARSEVLVDRFRILDHGQNEFAEKKVLFVLPIVDAGGGGNVVVDEARCMRKMGVDVTIFNLSQYKDEFLRSYPHLDIPVIFGGKESLIHTSYSYDAIVATANYSVEWLMPVGERNKNIELGYYVQGFEVLMYGEGTKDAERALASYSLIDNMKLFAKTEWVRNMVLEHSGANCANIGVSVNTDLFRPRHARQLGEKPVIIVAMVRPGSPYRNPKLTMEVLRKIEHQYKYEVDIRLFGSDDVRNPGLGVPTDFNWTQAGKLAQHQVANLLSDADIFVDFSNHQAMGLTALEAMACGCAVVVPKNGGAIEFVHDSETGIVVDTTDFQECYLGLKKLVENDDLRKAIQMRGSREVVKHYPEQAAYRILRVLFGEQ